MKNKRSMIDTAWGVGRSLRCLTRGIVVLPGERREEAESNSRLDFGVTSIFLYALIVGVGPVVPSARSQAAAAVRSFTCSTRCSTRSRTPPLLPASKSLNVPAAVRRRAPFRYIPSRIFLPGRRPTLPIAA